MISTNIESLDLESLAILEKCGHQLMETSQCVESLKIYEKLARSLLDLYEYPRAIYILKKCLTDMQNKEFCEKSHWYGRISCLLIDTLINKGANGNEEEIGALIGNQPLHTLSSIDGRWTTQAME